MISAYSFDWEPVESVALYHVATLLVILIVAVLLFSVSIYGLALGGPRALGPVTPLGGLCMICGWLSLLWWARNAANS